MPRSAVEVVDLVKRYGRRTAVDGLSLTVAQGSVTCVLGPNGAGKTTTVETCEGFRVPDGGTVRVLGLDPRDPALRPRVGVMLQGGGIPNAARPLEALRQHAALAVRPLDPDELVDRLGLRSALRTPYRRLSGGQQQRLALALALVRRPELVFLDEPTAGLDVQARHATWDLVEELRESGVTVVLTTHAMEEAERLADSIAIIDGGRVVTSGSPEQLTRSDGADALRFRGPSHLDLGLLRSALPADAVVEEERPGSYLVHGPVEPALFSAVSAWCASQGFVPDGIGVARRTLEDVFLDLTGRELRA